MKKIALGIAGLLLILVGVAGLILPILPGWPFVFLGLSMVAPAYAERLKRRVLRRFSKKELIYLENYEKYKIHAGFTTRHFPVILRKTDELSNPSKKDQLMKAFSESAVLASHRVSVGSRFVYLNQIHGDRIAVLDKSDDFSDNSFRCFSEADGVMTNIKEVALLVMTADCLSIFMAAGKGDRQWVALIHAGWRGTQKEIAKKAFQMLQERSECLSSEIRVIFGPCIGKDQYEVGGEFLGMFGPVSDSRSPIRRKGKKLYFDLAGENRRQLIKAGAKLENIKDLEICTVSENDDFYSFRKEKDGAGRVISFIKIAA